MEISGKRSFFLTIFSYVLVLASKNSVAQQDSYLKQLDEEAGGLSLDRKTRDDKSHIEKNMRDSSGLSAIPDDNGSGISGLPKDLSLDRFEAVLKRNFFGSYLFYKRLDTESRAWVYRQYQKNPDPERIRKSILKVTKRQRGEP